MAKIGQLNVADESGHTAGASPQENSNLLGNKYLLFIYLFSHFYKK